MTVKRVVLIASTVSFVLLYFHSSFSFAQTSSVVPTFDNKNAQSTPPGKRGTPPGPSERAASKDAAKQEIVKRIMTLANRMLSRASDVLVRLDTIWARVESRINTFKTAGKDVSGLSGWIQQVQIARNGAADSISSASASLKQIENSPSPKTAVKSYITLFREVKTALKAYHKSILTVIINLKGMSAQTGTVIPGNPTDTGSLLPTPTIIQPTITIGPT